MDCFHETMAVPRGQIDSLELLCRGPATGCGRDETVFDQEVRFDDGRRMAIQVVSPNEPDSESCWTQGVLFSADGEELGCTEAAESFCGQYRVEAEDGIYTVVVNDGSKEWLLTAVAEALESFADTCSNEDDAEADAAYAADLAMRVRILLEECK